MTLPGTTLLAATVNLPYKDILKVKDGLAPFAFSITKGALPPGLTLDPSAGVIAGTVPDAAVGKPFAFTVAVVDVNTQTAEQSYVINVNAYAFTVTPDVLPPVVPHLAYAVKIGAIGAIAPLAITFSGNLPAGLALDAKTGVLSADAGSINASATGAKVTVTITDKNGVAITKDYDIKIAQLNYKPVTFTGAELAKAPVGLPYKDVLLTSGGALPLAFKLLTGTLPSGLTLDPASGVISGTVPPASAGGSEAVFNVEVSDAYGQKDTRTFTLAQAPYAITVVPATVPTVIPTIPFSMQFAALGGVPPVKFALSGSLPNKLRFASDGTLSTVAPHVGAADAQSTWAVDLTATDANGVVGKLSVTVTVDKVPQNSSPLTIQTGSLSTMIAGTAYSAGVTVTGGVAPLSYALQSGALPVGLTLAAGSGTITGTIGVGAAGAAYATVLQVTDANGATATKTYSGVVSAGNSVLAILSSVVSTPIAGGDYSSVIAVAGGQPAYTFSIQSGALPGGLSINPATGVISGAVGALLGGTSYLFTVAVADTAAQTATKAYSGTIGSVSSPLAIQTTTLPNPVAGAGYSAGISCTGGVAPLHFVLQSGTLPTGLALDANSGVIGGTAPYSANGSAFAIVVKVTDAASQTATKTFTGTVQSGATVVTITTNNLTTPAAGTAYAGVVSVTGGVTPYAFTLPSGALPAGLALDAAAGVISGTPTYATAGTAYTFTVTVTDAINQTSSKTYSGTVGSVASTLVIATGALPAPVAGTTYSAGVSVTGGVSPFTFTLTSGTLPTGLSLDGPSGVVSGSLAYSTAGTSFAVVVKVVDSGGQSATKTYTGTVQNGATSLTIATASLTAPTAGSNYSGLVSVTGGVTPYAFAITAGTLPSGLALGSSTGAITGTPAYATAGTSFGFTVTVTDGSSQSAAKAYSGTVGNVSPAMAIQTATLVTPVAGAAYSAGISVIGGVSPLAFTVTSGALPTGLTLAGSTGIVSGNLAFSTAGVGYVVAINVTDAAGQTATKTYSDTVTNGATTLTIGAGALPVPLAGATYAAVVPVTGGVTPYAFTVSSGTLPTPLALGAASGVVSGVPAWASVGTGYAYTITVTDGSNQTASKTYSGTVGSSTAALTVATATIATPTAGAGYLASIAAAGGVPPYTFAVTSGTLPSPLTLAGGVISGTVSAALRNAPYLFTITATDSASHTASQAYSGNINDYALSVVPATLDVATPGVFYDTTVTAFGGVPPYTYALTGTLPSGLHLTAASGDISGNVADAESGVAHSISIGVTDANGATGTKAYSLSTATFAISVTTASVASAFEGQAYTNAGTPLAATGGTPPYTYDYTGSLPAGVGLTSAGAFFGTPAAGQGSLGGGTSYPVQVRVRDATNAVSAAVSLTVVVKVSAPTVPAGTLTTAVLGMPYTYTVAAAGGRPPYVYALVGSLPASLTLNTNTGAITGTATAAVTCPAGQFAITATDGLSQTSSASVYQCIPTSNGIVLANASLANAIEGQAYSNGATPLTASGGTAPYSYTYSGTLPSGVGLSNSGVFFGSPAAGQGSVAGVAYPLSLQVKDALNQVSLPVTLTLTSKVSLPAVAAGTPVGAVLGTPYSYTVTATGGRPPYTFANVGSLPVGLSLSAAGIVSGTPTGNATCPAGNFSVTATDALGQSSSGVTRCITTDNGINITNLSFPTVIIGTNYNSTVTVSGGTGPFTFAATNLPSGIVIDSVTGILSGFTNAASGDYTSFILVNDSSTPTVLTTTRSVVLHVRAALNLGAATLARAAAAPGAGISYGPVTLAATGGLAPLSFLVTAQSLPPGLALSASGVISGAPTFNAAVGSPFGFTVTATDAGGATASQTYSIPVSVAPVIATRTMSPAVVGVPYAADIQRVGGANPFIGPSNIASQLTWTATGLPAGLAINSTSGRIAGTTSAAAGSYPVAVGVTDAYGFSTSRTITLKLAAAGKTLDLKEAHFSEPCLANNTNCDPRAHAIAKLTGTSQQFLVYDRNDTVPKSLQIAMIDAAGRIPIAGAAVTSVNVPLPANIGTITSLQIADLDQDGKLDIVFVDNTAKQVCALWNAGTVNSFGMPTGFTAASSSCWVTPTAGDPANAPYAMTVLNSLRPDATNYGKQDLIITDSQGNGAGNSVVVMLNNCALAGACTGTRATLFQGYVAPTGTTTNASALITAVASTAGVAVGLPIAGVGIPAGATVASFVANTSITLSANATASNAGVALTTPTAVTPTGTTAIGSATITVVSSTAGVSAGMLVTGAGIPLGATVVSFVANTSITLSAAATAAAAGVALTVFGPVVATPAILAQASSKMTWLYDVGVGYFNAAAPNPTSTYATSAATCPSIVTAGFQQTATANGYLYILRQGFSGGQCQGDFQLHAASDEQFVAGGTPYLDGLAVADLNNDGISDIAVAIGNNNQTNSASLRVYMMPGGGTFTGATIIAPQLQTLNGQNVGAAKVTTYCVNGAQTCSYPSLLATCDREYVMTRVTGLSCLAILPNQCSTSGCTAAFEASTPTQRIDYPAPFGQNREPLTVPLVSTTNLTPTGNTTSGSASVTGVSSTTGVSVGQPITGPGIPTNCYVTAFTGTTLTLSLNATATAAAVTLTLPAAPTLNDVVLMGVDTTQTEPYFLVYARNGASATDPLKSSVMLNGFPASFLESAEIGTMKMADLNGDGSPDLLAYLVNQGTVSTYMSNLGSSPTYSLGSTLAPSYLSNPTYSGCPSGAASCLPDPIFNTMGAIHGYPPTVGGWHMQNTMDVMDINNDGIADVVVVGYNSRGVAVSLGTASGTLGTPVLYDVGTSGDIKPQAVAFVDLDQDGIPDIVVASLDTTGTQTAYISWLKGNGDGTFQPAQQITGITGGCNDPRSISAVDLDGDGRPELAVMCYQTQGVYIARRHTNGSWVAQTGPTINPAGGSNGTIMKFGRLTSTSGLDVVVGGLDTVSSLRIINGVSVTVTNASTGSFTLSSTPGSYIQLFGYPSDVDIADLNADGYGDIVVGMQSQNSSGGQNGEIFYSCQSTATGACALKAWGMAGYQTSAVVTGDVNGDGLPDVFVGYRANAAGIQKLIYRTISRVLNTSQ